MEIFTNLEFLQIKSERYGRRTMPEDVQKANDYPVGEQLYWSVGFDDLFKSKLLKSRYIPTYRSFVNLDPLGFLKVIFSK